jgi:hypothetical protein
MTKPDFRALCARMADELDHYRQLLMDDRRATHALANEARALLAQPEPQGPTDEEIRDLWNWAAGQDQGPWPTQQHCFARAVLARWGRPAIEPVPVSDPPGPEDCDAEGRCWVFDDMLGLPSWTLIKVLGKNLEPDMTWLPHWALPVPGGGRVPMADALLALTLLLALGAAVELSVKVIFVKLLPLLLKLH